MGKRQGQSGKGQSQTFADAVSYFGTDAGRNFLWQAYSLPEICLLLAELNCGCYNSCFLRIYERTGEESGKDFARVWEEEMGDCLARLPLREDEREAVAGLPKTMNFREEDGQSGRIGQAEAFLEGRYRQAEETYENRSKMIRKISILTGLLLIISLL